MRKIIVTTFMTMDGVDAVEGLGKFIPAQKNGKPVSCVLTLPIQFKLEQK